MSEKELASDNVAFRIFEEINASKERGYKVVGYVAVFHYRKNDEENDETIESNGIIFHGGLYSALGLLHHAIERMENSIKEESNDDD